MQRRQRPARKKQHSCLKLLLFYILIISLTAFLTRSFQSTANAVVSPIPDNHEPSAPAVVQFLTHEKSSDTLKNLVVATIGDDWKNYSVLVEDLNSDFSMGINEAVIFQAASINKIPILAALYINVEKGTVDLNSTITTQAEDIQDYGTGSIRYDEPGTTYSIRTLAQLMMQKSDNTAAYILGSQILGLDVIQSLASSWKLTQTNMENNETSNRDMAILMKKIFRREIVNEALTTEMLAFMKDSDFEDRIPGLLPPGTVTYHKIGTGVGSVHDVGIIVSGKTQYYIGIFTNDIEDEEQAAKKAAEVSKAVYDFMK
jgi:beta-lactamase class A